MIPAGDAMLHEHIQHVSAKHRGIGKWQTWHAAISQGDHADITFRIRAGTVCLRISNRHSSGSRGVSGGVTAWKETHRYLLAAEDIAPGYSMLKRGKERST
jgi:hypothetical protein